MTTPNYLDIYLDKEGYKATTARIIEENANKTPEERKIDALQAEIAELNEKIEDSQLDMFTNYVYSDYELEHDEDDEDADFVIKAREWGGKYKDIVSVHADEPELAEKIHELLRGE